MKTIIVWFRNDLRVHDHPALSIASSEADHVVPVFIFNNRLLSGNHSSSNRNRFLLESLLDLQKSLHRLGSSLVIRHGDPALELQKLCKELSATAVYYTADYTPFSIARDKAVKEALLARDITYRSFPGRLAVSSLQKLQTKSGTVHKVFTPFWRQWVEIERRVIATMPNTIQPPRTVTIGDLPDIHTLTKDTELSPRVPRGGETEARQRLKYFLENEVAEYHQTNNYMAANKTSRLSPYFHFGCISPREIETMLPNNAGARAWHRQLAWREFYNYVLLNNPKKEQELQERYRSLKWGNDQHLLAAWQEGKTGYPIVDAAMRQLLQEGWMHNRARLIVGSFLVKDLWLDWRLGESHFMHWLLDGDEANNNGNWQWIASVGVDPAPVYRRLYNPTLQQSNYDPDGIYVRRYVSELKNVPLKYLAEPWNMPESLQKEVGCRVGTDYPKPIVDHKVARLAALEQYRSV
jgi:deoxyribodipyrimidine photo-lyase